MHNSRLLLGCGILREEVDSLRRKNHWPLETQFLDSHLHTDFAGLSNGLTAALQENAQRDKVVFYGCCHPKMDEILAQAGTQRTAGQNCIEMLLGPEVFTRELQNGAYFLLEDWARHWDEILTKTFGARLDVIREIFQGDRKYILALRTPCSGDFERDAEAAGKKVGLPVRWMDVSLDHLETVLQKALARGDTQ